MDALIGLTGFLGGAVFLILLVINTIKKKPKKKSLIGLGVCFVLFVTGLAMPSSSSNTDLETESNQGKEIEVTKIEKNVEEKTSTNELTDAERNLLKKSYSDFNSSERTDYASILERFQELSQETQSEFKSEVERLELEKAEWIEEQKQQEKKEWETHVANNTKILSAGEHFVGQQIEKGIYDVTFSNGSGNFFVHSSDDNLLSNEIGGNSGISKYRSILPDGSRIKLNGIKATFTPVKRTILPYEDLELYAGYWLVGQDLTNGRYKVTTTGSNSGNFMVFSSNGSNKTNEILGGSYGVDEVIVNLKDGDLIQISSLSKVNFIPEN